MNRKNIQSAIIILLAALMLSSCEGKKKNVVKVGLLHSLTGTMAISETAVRDAELLAIKELNNAGGVLGCQIKPVEEDGKSNPRMFAEKARKLILEDKVSAIFGCWTSDSRKAVKPIVEEYYNLLWYPVQYEGFEASPNIVYTGAAPNQQVVPAIEFCAQNLGKKMFLIGSDYIFPRTANKIINAQLKKLGGECVGEIYVPMHESNFTKIIETIRKAKPDVIINTLNGDSNQHFFSQLRYAELSSKDFPVMSFSIAEAEIASIGAEKVAGHYVAWNYFESTETAKNRRFVEDYKNEYGRDRAIGDPVESAYNAIYLWASSCSRAGTFEVEPVRIAAKDMSFIAPEGIVTIDGSNQHLYKKVRIGKITSKGQIEELYSTSAPIRPDPYLSTYSWARGL